MINKVIIYGIKRADEYIPQGDICQMMGRAGRSYEIDKAEAILIVPKRDEIKAYQYISSVSPAINSHLNNVSSIAFHILPQIYNGSIYNEPTAVTWYNRSLAFQQGHNLNYLSLVTHLKNLGMIQITDDKLFITDLGKISCKYYINPERLSILHDKFLKINIDNKWNDYSLSWVLAYKNLHINEYAVNGLVELIDDYTSSVRSQNLYFEDNEMYHGLVYYSLFQGYRPKPIKYMIQEAYDELDRIFGILLELNKMYKMCKEDFLNLFKVKVLFRVNDSVAKIILDLGIKEKDSAIILEEYGIRTKQQLQDKLSILERYLEPTKFEKIKKYAE